MRKLAFGLVILMAAATAFSQGSTKNQLDTCLTRFNDLDMKYRALNEETKKLKTENNALKLEKDKAVKAAEATEALTKENQALKAKNKELTDNAQQIEANLGTMQTLAQQNNTLATENMNLKNQLAAAPTVPTAAPEKYTYPISGILTNKSVNNNVIISDLIFTNNGSKTITSFDTMLKFYYDGKKIYEIALPNVKNPAGNAFGRGESINFRAGFPVTDQNLVNAAPEKVDLIVEVTKFQ